VLSREENELFCRIGPETAMGKLMRRYWMPTIPSADLPLGCDPRRIRVLGEDLVAFRDRSGTIGIIDETCPHRGASMALARVEECGLRCLYHGWLVAADGRVLETPAEPEEHGFKERVRTGSYPVREAGGMVWTYFGPPDLEPPLPRFPFLVPPPENVFIMKSRLTCNWTQVVEGVLDSAHTNYLHSDALRPLQDATGVTTDAGHTIERPSIDGQPRIEAKNTDYGFMYAAIRRPLIAPEETQYVRITNWIAPFYSLPPSGKDWHVMHAHVPIDDDNTTLFFFRYRFDRAIRADESAVLMARSGYRLGVDVDERTWVHRNNATNNWNQDREAMRRGSWSGIDGILAQDNAMAESAGSLYDRSKEHLGTSDVAVIRMRRLMLDAARGLQTGADPIGMAGMSAIADLRAEEGVLPLTEPWENLLSRRTTAP
jgi:phthalate 4,5-dioxygenase oxygenase subunit